MTEHPREAATIESSSSPNAPAKLPAGWLRRWPWVTFLFPFIVYMLVGSLEPTPPPEVDHSGEARTESSAKEDLDDIIWDLPPRFPYRYYPWIYTAKIVLTMLAMLLVWRGYRTFPWKVSPLAVGVGTAGVILWIGLCHLKLEAKLLGSLGLGGFVDQSQRSAFNPLIELVQTPVWAKVLLAIRFIGLAIVVPVIEEFFLRGFMMRYVISERWWELPFGKVNQTALIAGTVVPMLMHPGELLAAMVWFSMVTWLMLRTRNIWDCVVAHATTNFLLGAYVVTFNQWQLM